MIRLALLLVLVAPGAHGQIAPPSADEVRSRLSDRTTIAGDGPDGWQVEYTAPGGVVYQWQPGLPVLEGRWSVRTHRGETQVCFTYPVNPATPGEEKCGDARYPLGLVGAVAIDSRQGDVFGLTDGAARNATGLKPAWPR